MAYSISQYNRKYYQVTEPDRVKSRGNTVGPILVSAEVYDTNDGPTDITVGASGANYTSLVTAYANASPGEVIEILDDTLIMDAALIMNEAVNGEGKAIKIKGKSTGTTVTPFATQFPFITTGVTAAIEFENIIFVDPASLYAVFINSASSGIARFINCTFNIDGAVYIFNVQECVFDGCTFLGSTNVRAIYVGFTDLLPSDASMNINNCTIDNTDNSFFAELEKREDATYYNLSVTNCNLRTNRIPVRTLNQVISNVNFKGNTIESVSLNAGIRLGFEATGLAITGFDAYSSLTSYTTGDLCYNLGILWESVIDSLDSEPTKSNANWKPAELITGAIENNLFKRDVYTNDGHGIFAGFGCFDMTIKNNIVSNYWWNIVIKGVNNTIQYNCTGSGFKGISIFANDQALVANNTMRPAADSAIDYGPQGSSGVGLVDTIFRDNILYSDVASVIILLDEFARWNPYEGVANQFTQNVYFGEDNPRANFEGSLYALSSAFDSFKVAIQDENAIYMDPEFEGVDPTLEAYYVPRNMNFIFILDNENQSIGAVDITKY